MNSCEYYQELISRLVDGEISREEHTALMAHMKTCSRCNTMYAVFHDLSDVLSEELEPLPEGLHENIMAGVRRSEIIKKNRRLRGFGLRTALTAAACALLVLFAASGFGPGKRMEDASIRTSEEAEQLYQAPAESAPEAADESFAVPAQIPAPTPARIESPEPAPAEAATPDVYLSAGYSVNDAPNIPQPEQIIPYTDQAPAPAVMQPSVPDAIQLPTPAPAEAQAPAPVPETENPLVAASESIIRDAVNAALESIAAAAAENNASAQTQNAAPPTVENAAPLAMPGSEPAAVKDDAAARTDGAEDEAAMRFSVNNAGADSVSNGLPDEAGGEPKATDASADEISAEPDIALALTPDMAAAPLPEEKDRGIEPPAALFVVEPEEQSVGVYGRERREKLFALLGNSESELPGEAELTRVVHVTLWPDDSYGSEEKLDINIYGDFVYYCLRFADGSVRSYRGFCSLRELDEFLREAAANPTPAPVPAPTVDPYVGEIPAALTD